MSGLAAGASAALWLKVAGVACTLAASTGAGWVVTQSFARRPVELQQCLQALSLLETEIAYHNLALPEAWDRVADRLSGPLQVMLRQAAATLRSAGGATVSVAWQAGLERLGQEGALTAADHDILRQVGPLLEGAGKDDQHRSLALVRQELEQALTAARTDQERNGRLWRYLGFAAGAALALLLI